MPLSAQEIGELYATTDMVPPEEEPELGCALPDPQGLPRPDELADLVKEHARLSAVCEGYRPDLWTTPAPHGGAGELEALGARLGEAAALLAPAEPWKPAVVAAGRSAPQRAAWEGLL